MNTLHHVKRSDTKSHVSLYDSFSMKCPEYTSQETQHISGCQGLGEGSNGELPLMGTRFIFMDDENVLELVVMVAQSCAYPKNH